MIFKGKKFKGALFRKKMWMELPFFFSAYRLMMVYICTKFHENIFDSIKVIEWTRFS